MLRKLLTLTLLCFVGVSYGFAQSGSIEGTVTDSNTGEPLLSANIFIPELERGTSTNTDGEYSIENVSPGTYTVRVTYIGYRTVNQQVEVDNGATVQDFALVTTNQNLEQMVVTGYETTTQEESNISVSTVEPANINSRPNVSAEQTLTGQVAGLNIQTTTGQPGANANINIRGIGSINGDTEPLVLLDGTPINQDNIGQLNPDIIASVTVLKDAGATAIYGNRGANGVIVIETKSGSYNSGVQVAYSGQLKTTRLKEDDYNPLDGIGQLRLEQQFTGGNFLGLTQEELDAGTLSDGSPVPNTNWIDVFFDPSVSNVHNLTISNGKENIKNFTSFGYTYQDGALNDSDLQRFNVRNNLTGRSENRKFDYSVNAGINYQTSRSRTSLGTSGVNQNPLIAAQESVPYLTPDQYPGSGAALLNAFPTIPFTITPLLLLDKEKYATVEDQRLKITGRASGTYEFIEGLSGSFQIGGDYEDNDGLSTTDPRSFNEILFAEPGNTTPGFSTTSATETFTYDLSTNLRYQTQFSDLHQVTAGAYFEMNQGYYTFSSFNNQGIFAPTFSPGDGSAFVADNSFNDFHANGVSLNKLQSGLVSYFGTLNYDYSNLYGIGLTLRRDASYRFTDDNEWGTFYSISGRWNIANEEFMDNDFFDALKLRASYGKSGSQNVVNGVGQFRPFAGNSLTRSLYGTGTGYNGLISTAFNGIGNPNLQWENQYQTNVGLDFEMFESKLSGAFDVYIKRTEDLFQSLPISAIAGQTSIDSNIGALENRGFEFDVDYDAIRSRNGFNLTIGILGNYNKNEVTDIPQEGGAIEFDTQIRREGGPLNEYYVYPYVGVNEENGNLLFLDIDGNETENPSPEDRRRTGKNLYPEFQGGFNIDMSYKGVFVQTQFQYATGIDRFDFRYANLVDPTSVQQFVNSEDLLDVWTEDNPQGSQPAINAANVGLDGQSDRFLTSSDFLRLRFASIGYRLPASILESVKLRGARISISGENLFDITDWRGLDPQTQSNNSRLYPNPSIYTLGIDLQF